MPIGLPRRLILAIAALSLVPCAPAFAQIFVPPPARWVKRSAPAPETTPVAPHGLEAAPTATPATGAVVPLGLSFAFADGHEHVQLDAPIRAVGTTDASVYVGGVDAYVMGCALSWPMAGGCARPDDDHAAVALNVGVLGGYADGRSTVAGSRLDLHGPAVGASSSILVQGPLWPFFEGIRTTPFVLGGFQYLATDYSEVNGWVHAYSVRPRTGIQLKAADDRQLFVYGGAAYEHFSEEQTLSDTDTPTHSRPRRAWAGLVGASYVQPVRNALLANVSLAVEGEVGDRASVALSVRFGFDVEL